MIKQLAIETFNYYSLPFYSKHLISDVNHTWLLRNSRLTEKNIEKSLFGESNISYFASSYTRHVTIDIDDHTSLNPWKDNYPSNVLVKKYNNVVKHMQTKPSFIVSTPRGMHCTWYFNEISPTITINRITKDITKNLNVEIKPTMHSGIRIPNLHKSINVDTLEPNKIELNKVKIYNREEIFDIRYSVTREESLIAKKEAVIGVIRSESLTLETLDNGHTNKELCYMAGVYRSCNIKEEEAVERFRNLLYKVNYTGDLLVKGNLERRMKSLYSGKDFTNYKRKDYEEDNTQIVEDIIDIVKDKIGKKSVKPLIRLINSILDFKKKQEIILKDHEFRAEYNEKYKFFNWNMYNKFTPLPSKVMYQATSSYHKYLPLLQSIGFLTLSDMNYSVGNYCKSYYIETDSSYFHKFFDAVCKVEMKDFYENIIKQRSSK